MAPERPRGKLDRLLDAVRAGDWSAALRLAASYADLDDEAAAIRRGYEATVRPQFYRELGRDTDADIERVSRTQAVLDQQAPGSAPDALQAARGTRRGPRLRVSPARGYSA